MKFSKKANENEGIDNAEIEQAVKEVIEKKRKELEIKRLQEQLANLTNPNAKVLEPLSKPATAKPAEQLPAAQGIEQKANALSQHIPKPKMPSILARKPKAEPVIYRHVSNETINLHASKLMPKDSKLQFIDPKAVELMTKATPRVKLIVEAMSKPVQKKSIDPRILIGAGVMAVLVIIGLTILYSQVIEPANKAQQAYDLQVLMHGGNATGIPKPNGGTGGLFQFKPINPFEPPPGTVQQSGSK